MCTAHHAQSTTTELFGQNIIKKTWELSVNLTLTLILMSLHISQIPAVDVTVIKSAYQIEKLSSKKNRTCHSDGDQNLKEDAE